MEVRIISERKLHAEILNRDGTDPGGLMSKAVCLLADWEADDYIKKGRIPDCGRHMHIKLAEAHEMTIGVGNYSLRSERAARTLISQAASDAPVCWLQPVAQWVGHGERRITMLVDFDYVPKTTAHGHVLMNRIEL